MTLEEKVKSLPEQPGVYLFKEGTGDVIYVGKATSLKQRVRQYFQSARNLTSRILSMVAQATDLDFIVVGSEMEALIFESNLIKKHHPKYNIRLRDDKHYPYLRITLEEEWPRVLIARAMRKDGSRYFGPYTRSGAVNETLQLIRRIFPLRTCSDAVFRTVERPCLNYHINRCLGPCKGLVSHDEYAAVVKDICTFLEGNPELLAKSVRDRMENAAENLDFEKAAQLRDQLHAIQEVTEKQKIISDKAEDRDVIGVALHDIDAVVQVFQVRAGKMIGAEQVSFRGPESQSIQEVVDAFLAQYYTATTHIPEEVLLPVQPEDRATAEKWMSRLSGHKVRLRTPSRGQPKALIEMANKNALLAMDELRPRVERERDMALRAAKELAETLGLPAAPERIECYDISNIQGTNSVGSMVVFSDGAPKKEDYRHFKIKSVKGQNDFAMMGEVLERRFARGLKERAGESPGGSFATFPDLLVVDGGKGQLGVAVNVLSSLNIGLPVIGLAKREEEVFVPGQSDPVILDRDSHGLRLLQRIRDEAHRFAVGYHRKLRSNESRRSILDEVPGVGPKRRAALLKRFGTIKAISEATLDELATAPGMNRPAAERVIAHLTARD